MNNEAMTNDGGPRDRRQVCATESLMDLPHREGPGAVLNGIRFTLGECALASVDILVRRGAAAVLRPAVCTGLALAALAQVGCAGLDSGADTFDKLSNTEMVSQPQNVDWSCVGKPLTAPPTNIPEAVTYTFPFVEWVSDLPVPGRTLQVCNKVDPMCTQPIQGTEVTIAPNQRDVSVTLRGGLNVFFDLGATPDYLRDTLWLDGPLYSNQSGGRIQLLSLQTVGSLAASASLPIDPTGMTGIVVIRAHDCTGAIAGGALYEINDTSPSASSVYPYTFINGAVRGEPVPGTKTTIPSDGTPWAGFINVRPGPLTVRGLLADTDQEFGTAETFVKAGQFSVVEVRPLDHL